MSETDSVFSHSISTSSSSKSDSESESEPNTQSSDDSSSQHSYCSFLASPDDNVSVNLNIFRQSMSGKDEEDFQKFNSEQQSLKETLPPKQRKRSKKINKPNDKLFRPKGRCVPGNRTPLLRPRRRLYYNEEEIAEAMYETADTVMDTEESSDDEVDPTTRFITMKNYTNFGYYYQHTEAITSNGQTTYERRFYPFIDCVGLQKVHFVSKSGLQRTAIVAWLIEPLQPPCSISMVDSQAQVAVRRMLRFPNAKPKRMTRKHEVNFTSFASQENSTMTGHLWKVIAPTQKTVNNPKSYKENSFDVFVEYQPFPVTLEKICPGGLRFIMSKYSIEQGWFSNKAFKRPFHCFQKLKRDKKKIKILSDTLPMVSTIMRGETRKFLNYYDFEQFRQDTFDFSTTGRYQQAFLAQHFQDVRTYQDWIDATDIPILEVNWNTIGVYKSEIQIKYKIGDFDKYSFRGDQFLNHRQFLKRYGATKKPTIHLLDKKEAFLRASKIVDVLFDCTEKAESSTTEVKPLVCPWCTTGTVYASANSLETHWNLRHPEKKTQCTECINIVSRHWEELGLLSSHRTKRHNLNHPFACSVCSQRFQDPFLCERHEVNCLSNMNNEMMQV